MARRPILADIFPRIAPRIGAVVHLEPQWGIAGQITFASGRKRYFRFSSIDMNPLGASEIAKDKDYAAYFMQRMGYPVPEGRPFYSPDWAKAIGSDQSTEAAYGYARELGFPVLVKPNSGSQGKNVAVAFNRRELLSSLREAFKNDRVALVQRIVRGRDYRLVVLDDVVISAYERIPLNIVGDGASSILQLLEQKQRQFIATGRDTVLAIDDIRMRRRLARHALDLNSVIRAGETVYLLDNANLSAGGEAVDVTDVIHPDLRDFAVRLTRDMGLRLCGVDLVFEGDASIMPTELTILEVNAAPGLDHYAQVGTKQAQIVEDLYLEVLKGMDTGP